TGTSPASTVVTDDSDTGTTPEGEDIPDPANTDSDGDEDNGNDPTETNLPEVPSIDLVKTFVVDQSSGVAGRVDAGDKLTYTFEVTNTGNVTLTGVSLSTLGVSGEGDYDISEAEFVSATEESDEGELVPGETATDTLTYTLTQEDVDARELT